MPKQLFTMSKPLFTLLIIPILLAGCAQNNVTEDNSLKKYFDAANVTGSFGLFDNGQGHFTINNLPRFRDSSYLPAATFDIPLSLIAVQTGVAKDDSALISWDTASTNAKGECEPGITLKQAFRQPCPEAFAELARRIGKDTLTRWIDSLGYGNKNMTGFPGSFWQNNQLKITSDEQLGLMKKLYFDQLPFFQRSQKIVRNMMVMESNANYRLSYKAGRGYKEDGHILDWIVGWVEENNHLYFFVLNLESANPVTFAAGIRILILKDILRQMGFFEGKK
jgi:beta-lactamase class D